MKKIVNYFTGTFIIFCIGTLQVLAQTSIPPGQPLTDSARNYKPYSASNKANQDAQVITNQMVNELNLSGDQIPKVLQINTSYRAQLDNAYSSMISTSDPLPTEKIKEINNTRAKALDSVLTVTQSNQFKKLYPGN